MALPTLEPGQEKILVVDDEPAVRTLLVRQLESLGYPADAAVNGDDALLKLSSGAHPDLLLIDVKMPGLSGPELLKRAREIDRMWQVIMVSGSRDLETVRQCMRDGAYDFLLKPFELEDLSNTVTRALERGRLLRQNESYRENLERMVEEQTEEIRQTRDIAVITLARLAESRDNETGHHLERMAEYSRILARALKESPYADIVTEGFVDLLFKSSPLHDIGKVGIPDSILLKPGALTDEENDVMRTHTIIGGDTLRSVIEEFREQTFLNMGMEIAYSHHEKWDGSGYPAGLRAEEIPLAARIVGLTDAYDAITSDRPYKPAHDHQEAMRRIVVDRGKHFDPILVDAFLHCESQFASVRLELQGATAGIF